MRSQVDLARLGCLVKFLCRFHRPQARLRAMEAAQKLHEASEAGKVYLAAHGWFNRMLRPELKKLGWRCVRDGGDSYWSFRIYEYR